MFFTELCGSFKNEAGVHISGSQPQAYLVLQVTNTIFKKR